MRKFLILLVLLICVRGHSQGFEFDANRTKAVIPFKLINSLVFVPIKVNGVELNFLLDSGVEETILFSLDDKDEVSFNNVESVELRGLGSQESVKALKSSNNYLSFFGFHDYNHDIFIILDQNFNFSSHIGIPVNGIIGYHFFKNNLVEIDYDRKRIIVYKNYEQVRKKVQKKFVTLPMLVEKRKPYIEAEVFQDTTHKVKLLVDTGSSDAVWLFDGTNDIKIPERNFDDYLGRGFSGEIFGKRARIPMFRIGNSGFQNPIIAFPDATSIKNLNMVAARAGSVGGEILRRHTVIFDYRSGKIHLKRGRHFEEVFNYNMSGLELQHGGLQWVQETVPMKTVVTEESYNLSGDKIKKFTYKFELKPIYTVAGTRAGSPAEEVGLQKGDVVVSVNNRAAYRFSLQQLNNILKTEDGRLIEMTVEREGKILEFEFRLKALL